MGQHGLDDIILGLFAIFVSLSIHEFGHAYMAFRCGDDTAAREGRLTLNPLAHIDPMGSIVLPLILVFTNSPVLFGWAKPVPFNPGYFRDVRKGVMIVGAAGPVANLVLAAVAAAVFRILTPGGFNGEP